MWNLFCFHMLEEPQVFLRITYRDHWFKSFRCCLLRLSPVPTLCILFTACDQARTLSRLVRSLTPPLCLVSRTLYKTDECLHAGSMPVVLGGNFPQHSRPTVYICHSVLLHLKQAVVGHVGEWCIGRSLLCCTVLENCACTPSRFFISSSMSSLSSASLFNTDHLNPFSSRWLLLKCWLCVFSPDLSAFTFSFSVCSHCFAFKADARS